MKTRDRILHTSLLLFNEEGEPNTTTVDIANEMDISPGNLYYHCKGKGIIIAELFSQFEQGLGEVLKAPLESSLDVEDNWFYLYVVFEEMYNYRFLYHNLSDLLQRYPDLSRRFRRILRQKHAALRAVWEALGSEAELSVDPAEVEVLIDNMVLLLNHWLTYERLLHEERPPAHIIHQGVYQLMIMLAPYLGGHHREFYQRVRGIYQGIRKS